MQPDILKRWILPVLKHPANHKITPPATSLDARDFDNNRRQIKKTPRNAPQTTDLLFPVLITSLHTKHRLGLL